MDEMMMWREMFGGFGTGVDLTALLAFVASGSSRSLLRWSAIAPAGREV